MRSDWNSCGIVLMLESRRAKSPEIRLAGVLGQVVHPIANATGMGGDRQAFG